MYKSRQPSSLHNKNQGSISDNRISTIPRSPQNVLLSPISESSFKNKSSKAQLANLVKGQHARYHSTEQVTKSNKLLSSTQALTIAKTKSPTNHDQTFENPFNNVHLGSEVPGMSRRLSLSKPNSISYVGDFITNVSLHTEVRSPKSDGLPPFRYMNDADLIKQEEYINTSPHFAKFSKQNYLLGQIERSKPALSKELFYYPEQLELNRKLKESALNSIHTEEDIESGIISKHFIY